MLLAAPVAAVEVRFDVTAQPTKLLNAQAAMLALAAWRGCFFLQ
jgi:hypothetical protein